jgi:hypothetical protein
MSIKLNVYLLYGYFQQNQCLNIKKHAIYIIHRLVCDPYAHGPPGNCTSCPCNKYTFNFIDIYSFIPASACVGMGPSALLCLGAYNAAKMALYHYIYVYPTG